MNNLHKQISQKPFILLVDDDPYILESVSETLSESGRYSCLTATNGEEALCLMKKHRRWFGLKKHRISCVITDIKMPVMDGLSFLSQWRQLERFELIPFVLLSAYEDDELWARATHVSTGLISGYLKKPIKENTLLECLDRIVFRHESELMIDEMREQSYNIKSR